MAVFKSVIDQFDGSSDLAEAQREALEALSILANTKREKFASEINLLILDAGTGTNKTVPISKVLRSDGLSRAFSSSSSQDISDTVKKALTGFIEGGTNNIIEGVFGLISKTLEIFLGNSTGSDEFISQYFVYATDFGIYRVDLFAWSRTIVAKSLRTKIQQATAYQYSIANVDLSKITFSDFATIFALQLDRVPSLTKEQRAEARAHMKETWEFLTGVTLAEAQLAQPPFESILSNFRIPLTNYTPITTFPG